MAFFLEMLVIEPPPDNQPTAIAQMCKRFTYDDAVRLSCRHDNGRERDAMLNSMYTREPPSQRNTCTLLTGGEFRRSFSRTSGKRMTMVQATDSDTTTANNVRPFPGMAPEPPTRSNARPKDPTSATRSKRYRKKRKHDAKRDADGADR